MESKRFSETLKLAVAGDSEAVLAILVQYMPLINKQSKIKGEIDEDLRQFIILRIVEQIPRF